MSKINPNPGGIYEMRRCWSCQQMSNNQKTILTERYFYEKVEGQGMKNEINKFNLETAARNLLFGPALRVGYDGRTIPSQAGEEASSNGSELCFSDVNPSLFEDDWNRYLPSDILKQENKKPNHHILFHTNLNSKGIMRRKRYYY